MDYPFHTIEIRLWFSRINYGSFVVWLFLLHGIYHGKINSIVGCFMLSGMFSAFEVEFGIRWYILRTWAQSLTWESVFCFVYTFIVWRNSQFICIGYH